MLQISNLNVYYGESHILRNVDMSVAYVAPLNLALEDERIYKFLDTVGTKACRHDLLRIQRRVLTEYDESLQRLEWFNKGAKNRFDYYLSLCSSCLSFPELGIPVQVQPRNRISQRVVRFARTLSTILSRSRFSNPR